VGIEKIKQLEDDHEIFIDREPADEAATPMTKPEAEGRPAPHDRPDRLAPSPGPDVHPVHLRADLRANWAQMCTAESKWGPKVAESPTAGPLDGRSAA
jgi:hypothetical protein